MSPVSIRDLQRNTSGVVAGVAKSKRPALITRHGKPVAALVPIDSDALEDYLLSNLPGLTEDLAEADAAIAAGDTRPADEVFAELDAEDRAR
jgi:prevent-host-death family protein